MLDKYKNDQPIVYRLLKNSINKNMSSHAYLFQANGYSKALDMAIEYAKELICPKNDEKTYNCEQCNICNSIDKNTFSEIKIINPDGLWIKKEQIDDLRYQFSKKAVEVNKKIYIINNAEKLNNSSSNSILKFLEEPEDNIIAILISNNINQIMETIISRCQVISFKNYNYLSVENTINKIANIIFMDKQSINKFLENTSNEEKIQKIIYFIQFYEKNKISTILHLQKLWHDYFDNKEEIALAYDIITLYYKDVINFKEKGKLDVFDDYIDTIEEIAKNNSVSDIGSKINVVLSLKEKIKLNVNNALIMDKLIIALEEV